MSERSQLRANQVITTFGPGAMVDLPGKSVIIAGLQEWKYKPEKPCTIVEPRLAAKIGRLLEKKTVELRSPPPAEDLVFSKGTVQPAVTGYVFPHWFIVQNTQKTKEGHRRRRLVNQKEIKSNGRFRDPDDNKDMSVVPVRFVRACPKGHVGDLDWRGFVHQFVPGCMQPLWMEERGTTGDLSEIFLVCECGAIRSMRDAAKHENAPLGKCNGSRPWLDDRDPNGCDENNRLLQRTASNAYFAQVMSVISIPNSMAQTDVVVLQHWDNYLQFVTTEAQLDQERQRPALTAVLQPFTNQELFSSIERIRGGHAAEAIARPVKEIEFQALSGAKPEALTDEPDGDFFARSFELDRWQVPWLSGVQNVILVHRLREVTALVGFTRFDAAGPDVSGELDIDVQRAPLIAGTPKWMPAVENRGEGVFLHFRKDAIEEWLQRPAVQARDKSLREAFEAWRSERNGVEADFPGVAYIMLHSLSHLLMTSISLECGYPASSLRERIYSPIPSSSDMAGCYGILILTSSSDAQGTLGGLVYAARDIRRHLARACQLGSLCSNDPVCSSHTPGQGSIEQLSGSACHGCLYVAETSCEQFNRYLDRSLVVSTIDQRVCEFLTPTP